MQENRVVRAVSLTSSYFASRALHLLSLSFCLVLASQASWWPCATASQRRLWPFFCEVLACLESCKSDHHHQNLQLIIRSWPSLNSHYSGLHLHLPYQKAHPHASLSSGTDHQDFSSLIQSSLKTRLASSWSRHLLRTFEWPQQMVHRCVLHQLGHRHRGYFHRHLWAWNSSCESWFCRILDWIILRVR